MVSHMASRPVMPVPVPPIGAVKGRFSPYHNLILTGYMGVGKVAVGRAVAERVGVPFVDLDTEIQLRSGYPPDELRELFGESRLKAVEHELCRELALQRGALLSLSGPTLLDDENRDRLLESSFVIVLTCALNEILRRMHAAQGARFHDPKVRGAAMYQLRRERQIHQLPGLTTLDTSRLSVAEVAERVVAFWQAQETIML